MPITHEPEYDNMPSIDDKTPNYDAYTEKLTLGKTKPIYQHGLKLYEKIMRKKCVKYELNIILNIPVYDDKIRANMKDRDTSIGRKCLKHFTTKIESALDNTSIENLKQIKKNCTTRLRVV